jgi:hypothetical protein
MRVLVACEYSGIVRDAFIRDGFDAMSCDLLETESPGPHYQGDVRDLLGAGWDLLIAHPDCTYLTCSAEWAYGDGPYHQKVRPGTLVGAERRKARKESLRFVELLMGAPIKHKCIENPRGVIGTRIKPATQYIQPHEYGHDASKTTGLWLENLPPLVPTRHITPRIVNGRPRWANQTDSGQNKLTPGPNRWKDRARTYRGWADAMADQWGKFLKGGLS